MQEYHFDLEQDVITYIERLNYEYETLKDSVSYMVHHFSYDRDFLQSDLFRKYQDNQINAKLNLERAMREIADRYIPENLKAHRIGWSMDFRRNMLVVTRYCDCEVSI